MALLQTGVPAPVQEQEVEENEILYLCTYEGCGKGFADAGSLRKHAHTHGEKQFICHYEGCGKVSKKALFSYLCVIVYLCFYTHSSFDECLRDTGRSYYVPSLSFNTHDLNLYVQV